MDSNDTTQAATGHAMYLAEVRQFVDNQVERLFDQVAVTLASIRSYGLGAPQATVGRHGHTLTVTADVCMVVLEVQAISDLPEGANRAYHFPAGQARCLVHVPDGRIVEWVLRRDNVGDTTPSYVWMVAGSDTRVGKPEIESVLRPLLACATRPEETTPTGAHILAASAAR